MKKTIILSISILFSVSIYAQKTTKNDTLICKTVVPSRWAIEFDMGASLNQVFKPSYMDNIVSETFDYKIFYRNFYFLLGESMTDFTPTKDMTFNHFIIHNQNGIMISTMNTAFGYIYNFNKKWSADVKIGLNSTYCTIDYNNNQDSYGTDIISGSTYGIGINRYFKLKGYSYIVVSLGADYYNTDLSKLSPDMNPNSLNWFLTVAYKGFFKKVID